MIPLLVGLVFLLLVFLVVGAFVSIRSAIRLAVRIKDADARASQKEAEAATANRCVAIAEERRKFADQALEDAQEEVRAAQREVEQLKAEREARRLKDAKAQHINCDSCNTTLAVGAHPTEHGEGSRNFCSTPNCLERAQRKVVIRPRDIGPLLPPRPRLGMDALGPGYTHEKF